MMKIHDILALCYESEALLRLLTDSEVKKDTEKYSAIVELVKSKTAQLAVAADQIRAVEAEVEVDQPHIIDKPDVESLEPQEEVIALDDVLATQETAEEISENEEIAESATFEEKEDADLFDAPAEEEPIEEQLVEEQPVQEELVEEQLVEEEPVEEECFDEEDAQDEPLYDINQSAFRKLTGADLSKAFTLNDNFRFRRELFGNSQIEFNDAINLVAAMHSPAEADEYFLTELGWDAENEDVRDFMNIIHSFLAGR